MKKLINIIIVISSTIIGVKGQQTPVWPVSSLVSNYNQINCTFAEKHSSFHGALDIHTADGTVFLGILDGKVKINANGSNQFFVTHHDFEDINDIDKNLKVVRYGDNTENLSNILNNDDFVQGEELGYQVSGGHLHFEMWVRDCVNGCDWYLVNPLKNKYPDYHNLPPGYSDSYEVELNDIILEPQDNKSGIIFSEGDGLQSWHYNSCKIHKKDRPDSSGDIYPSDGSKITIFGSILPTVHVRDTKVTDGVNSIGEGLGIYECKYSINNQLKYHIAFEEIQQLSKNKWAVFFNSKYNTATGNSVLYGNHDYIKLFRLESDEYLAPHKVIDRGIWKTRGLKGNFKLFTDIPDKAEFIDDIYNTEYIVADASGNSDRVRSIIYVDNFKPYITDVNIRYNNELLYQAVRAGNEGSSDPDDGFVMNRIHEYPISPGQLLPNTLTVEILTSEPMQNVRMSYKKAGQITVFPNPVAMTKDITDNLRWTGSIATFNPGDC